MTAEKDNSDAAGERALTALNSWFMHDDPNLVVQCRVRETRLVEANLRDASALTSELAGRWLLFPGSFNPLHRAHRAMMASAQRMHPLDRAAFEISVKNAEKGSLDAAQIVARLAQPFAPPEILLTRASRFDEKARLFPGTRFVVGADTMARILDGRFYSSTAERKEAIEAIVERNCRFIVFSRRLNGQLLDSQSVVQHSPLDGICKCIPTDAFCFSDSSSRLRSLDGNGGRQQV